MFCDLHYISSKVPVAIPFVPSSIPEISNPPSAPSSEKQSPMAQQHSPNTQPAASQPNPAVTEPNPPPLGQPGAMSHQSPVAQLPTAPPQTYTHESR